MKTRIPASELQVGDIVDKGNYAYQVEIIETTENMVHVAARYTKCAFDPERVGMNWHISIRKSTMLNVERAEDFGHFDAPAEDESALESMIAEDNA